VRVAIGSLPEAVQAQVAGDRAVVTHGPEGASVSVSVAVDDGHLILFPERSYKHDDLVKALGLA
jgi:hypothetical protein